MDGFHPPSLLPGNKYESLVRGLLDFPESSQETVPTLWHPAERVVNMSWFLWEIKSSDTTRVSQRKLDISRASLVPFSSELRSWPWISPEMCLRWRLLRVSCRRNIFRLLLVHTLFLFSDSLSPLYFPCTTLQNIPLQSSHKGMSKVLMQTSVATNSYMMITAEEFTRVLDSCTIQ